MSAENRDPVLSTCAQILDHTSLQALSVASVLEEVMSALGLVGDVSAPEDVLELGHLFSRLGSAHRALADEVESWEAPILDDPSILRRVAEVAAETARELDGVEVRFGLVTDLLAREELSHRAQHVRNLVPYVRQLREDCNNLNLMCSSTTQPLDIP